MDRNPAWLYKTLVVGVIVLFIRVGIQPAFAITPNTSEIESEEECNIYSSISTKITGEFTRQEKVDWHDILCGFLLSILTRIENRLVKLTERYTFLDNWDIFPRLSSMIQFLALIYCGVGWYIFGLLDTFGCLKYSLTINNFNNFIK